MYEYRYKRCGCRVVLCKCQQSELCVSKVDSDDVMTRPTLACSTCRGTPPRASKKKENKGRLPVPGELCRGRVHVHVRVHVHDVRVRVAG